MTAEDLRKAILQQAIQGKLLPQDPNDEPASKLLERIREEKARLVKEKKIKKDKNESIIYRGEDNSHYEKFADGTVKCIDDEIPFEIPQSWEWCKINNIAFVTKLAGFEYTKYIAGNLQSNGVPLFKGKNVQEGKIIYDFEAYIPEFVSDELERSQVSKKCLLTPYVGTIGNIGIHNRIGKFHLGSNVGKIEILNPNNNVCLLEEYVHIYLMSKYGYAELTKYKKATAQESISIEAIREVFLPIPPINEQKRIVQKIEDILPLIEKYRIAQEQAEEMDKSLNGLLKKSILQYAIQGKLVPQIETEEPASVLLEKIQQEKLQLVKEGKLKKKELDNSFIFKGDDNKYYEKIGSKTTEITEEIPYELPNNWVFVRLSNLCWLDNGFKASGEKLPYMDAQYHRDKSERTYITQGKIVEPPCKVILVDGENSGEIFNITEKGYLGSTFKLLQISKCISEEWLHILLNTYRDLFKNSKVGAAIPHLNKNLFRNLIVGLPPIEEQQRINDRIEKMMKCIEGL